MIQGQSYYDPYYNPYYPPPPPLPPHGYPAYPYPYPPPPPIRAESAPNSFNPAEAERTIKQAAQGTRSLADIVDDLSRGSGGDMISDFLGGGNGNGFEMDKVSQTIRGTADFMEKGTATLMKLSTLFH